MADDNKDFIKTNFSHLSEEEQKELELLLGEITDAAKFLV